MVSDISHHPLARADGSATISSPLFSVLAGVNGPVDVTRRDELPDEAALEINIRPSSGIGGPRERWLESVIAVTLRAIVLVHMHPRTLIQVTLQITKDVEGKITGAKRDIALLPVLFNAAFLALVDARIPLATTASAVLCGVKSDGNIVDDPTEKELIGCTSVHALAFSLKGKFLLNESSGEFTLEEWTQAAIMGRKACLAAVAAPGDDEQMLNATKESVPWLTQELEEQARDSQHWRKDT